MRVWRIDVDARRLQADRRRELPPGGRHASRPGRDPEREPEPRDARALELDVLPLHGPEQPRPANEQLVLADLPALPPRHRHLARRFLRRDREHRREPARAPLVRLPDALEHLGHGSEPGARLDREVGRGLVPLGAGDGRRDLRRRSPAVDEQPVQPEQLWPLRRAVPGRRRPHRLLGARPLERPALQLEPRPQPPGQGRARDGVHADRASSSGATPTGSTTRRTGGTRSCRSRAASRVPANAEYGLPGGFFTVGQSGTPGDLLRRTSFNGSDLRRAQRGERHGRLDERPRRLRAERHALHRAWRTARSCAARSTAPSAGATTSSTCTGWTRRSTRCSRSPARTCRSRRCPPSCRTPPGMFFEDGFLYYTVQGDPRLYARASPRRPAGRGGAARREHRRRGRPGRTSAA